MLENLAERWRRWRLARVTRAIETTEDLLEDTKYSTDPMDAGWRRQAEAWLTRAKKRRERLKMKL